MERIVTDAFIEQLTKKISEDLARQLTAQWGIVINELANTRESSRSVTEKLAQFEIKFTDETADLRKAYLETVIALQNMRETNRKASEILKKASKDLGLSE